MKNIDHSLLEARLREAVEKASLLLKHDSIGVLCRKPLLDEDCPEASDVDLLSIWGRPEEYPERMLVETSLGRVFVDILWIPMAAMLNPVESASYRMLPHLLLESQEVWIGSRAAAALINQIRLNAHGRETWGRRVGSQICFGDEALREAPRNLDFPPAAVFYLQTAHAYYIMALADSLRQSVMSLRTHPVTRLRRMSVDAAPGLEKLATSNLHLEAEPSPSLAALKRLYNAVNARCKSRKPLGIDPGTIGQYAYSLSPLELEYREAFAEALIRRGDLANANFYLRFWAYSLSRCPIVLEEAERGVNPSFYVPYEPLKNSLLKACPEAFEDLELILGGEITRAEAEESIRGTLEFRRLVLNLVEAAGLQPHPVKKGFLNAKRE
ncbi:MAG: hypothetical protein QW482_06580 [Thermoproteota archaeon]